jgi:hypothetical protein
MNRPFACAFILLVAVSGGSPAGAQPVMPGEEGELVNFLPPEVGRRVCYARVYSQQHLAKHPKQKVAEIQFRLTYYRHEPDDYAPQGQRNYYFEVHAGRLFYILRRRLRWRRGQCDPPAAGQDPGQPRRNGAA